MMRLEVLKDALGLIIHSFGGFGVFMEEMQNDPEAAMQKYKDDEALQDFLQEFMGLMGDHMVNLGEAKKEKEAKQQKEQQVLNLY